MAKIVYNSGYGGYSLSDETIHRYAELKGLAIHKTPDGKRVFSYWRYNDHDEYFDYAKIPRHDPCLVQAVEELGPAADGGWSDLNILEVPDGTLYYIDEYDGNEVVITESQHKWEVAE